MAEAADFSALREKFFIAYRVYRLYPAKSTMARMDGT
jgi:hypothetical protein